MTVFQIVSATDLPIGFTAAGINRILWLAQWQMANVGSVQSRAGQKLGIIARRVSRPRARDELAALCVYVFLIWFSFLGALEF